MFAFDIFLLANFFQEMIKEKKGAPIIREKITNTLVFLPFQEWPILKLNGLGCALL